MIRLPIEELIVLLTRKPLLRVCEIESGYVICVYEDETLLLDLLTMVYKKVSDKKTLGFKLFLDNNQLFVGLIHKEGSQLCYQSILYEESKKVVCLRGWGSLYERKQGLVWSNAVKLGYLGVLLSRLSTDEVQEVEIRVLNVFDSQRGIISVGDTRFLTSGKNVYSCIVPHNIDPNKELSPYLVVQHCYYGLNFFYVFNLMTGEWFDVSKLLSLKGIYHSGFGTLSWIDVKVSELGGEYKNRFMVRLRSVLKYGT